MTTAPEDPTPGAPATARPRRRPLYLIAAVLLAAVSAGAVAVASSQVDHDGAVPFAGGAEVQNIDQPFPAPDLPAGDWLNTEPLTASDLDGKVVLYDFWTYSCVNCLRTTPYLNSWHERYAGDGLVMIGIHSPEFDFEKDGGNVADATKRLGIEYPVALDPDLDIWNTFNNQYWPAKYITDRDGTVVHFQAGEGGYSDTEDVIRTLLGVDAGSPRAASPRKERSGGSGPQESVSRETFLFNLSPGTAVTEHPEPGPQQRHNAALAGPWSSTPIDVTTSRPGKLTSGGPGATIVMAYVAREVNLVMAVPDGKPRDVVVTIDGKPVPPELRAADIQAAADGRTFVRVDRDDMYRLILGPEAAFNELRLVAPDAGLDAFAFTFGA